MFNNRMVTSNSKVVLVIEDSPTQALNLQDVLERAGLLVVCATNGYMGIQLARQTHPALIVLDVQMPGIDGFEVCEKLKKAHETADIPIIMFTRNDTPEALQMSLESGVVDFIPKDAFATVVLVETIRQMGLIA